MGSEHLLSCWDQFGFPGRNCIPGRETGDRRGGARILEEAGSTLGPPGRPRVAPTHHPNFSGKVAVPGTCCRKGTWNPSPAPRSKPWIGTSHSPVFQEPFWKFFLDISLELAWPESSRAGRGGLTSPGEWAEASTDRTDPDCWLRYSCLSQADAQRLQDQRASDPTSDLLGAGLTSRTSAALSAAEEPGSGLDPGTTCLQRAREGGREKER